jgi:hypothetical protein
MRMFGTALMGLAAIGMLASCEEPRKEKPRDRITRLRLHYQVSANWYEMQKDKDGKPVLAMELTVTNTGKEALKQVTMVLHVSGFDGKDRVKMPLTLDTSNLTPAVKAKISVAVPGVEVRAGEEVTLQMEGQPSKAEMGEYPEYKAGVS